MTDPAVFLSIRNASKSYAGVPALKSAALDLNAGEVHALMGENGAGKSTLIKILAGVLAPDDMDIRRFGAPVTIGSTADATAHGFRFIHQELNVVPQLSVAENLFLGRAYPMRAGLLVDWPALNRAARATLARLGIDHINPKQKIARLETGDQMLVRIAAMLLDADDASGEPLLYVMDEPTAALTGAESEQLFRVIDELRAAGNTVLYISHRLDEVLRLCDRVTVMRDGETIATTPIGETNEREIIRLMTGREMTQVYPARRVPVSDDLCLSVRDLAAGRLRAISLEVHSGEILGIAGLAGSGTGELLRALMGAVPQSAGDISLRGNSVAHLNPTAAWHQSMAFVPRERRSQGLVLARSIRDNVTLPHLDALSAAGLFVRRARERARTNAVSQQVRLRSTGPEQATYKLSGGNQQKVVFARALAEDPVLLLLDEPTRGVDVGAKYDIYSLIRTMSVGGVAVIMASSDLSELLGMCDRILVMVHHRVFATVATAGLTQEALLRLCYGKNDSDE